MRPGRAPVQIHPSATVEEGTQIGPGTRIFVNVQIRTGARIGSDCILGKDVFVDAGVTIGDRVKIQNGVSVYRGVTVEDEVFLGPHCVTTNDLDPSAVTTDGRLKAESDWTLCETVFRTGARIGAGAVVVCGSPRREIGRWALVAAGAVVTRDVLDFELVAGNPARRLRFVCPSGLGHEVTVEGGDPLCQVCHKKLDEVIRR